MQLATADGDAPRANGIGAIKEERKLKRSNSFARALGPTMVCVYALLVLKTAQQGFVDSLPLITVRRSRMQTHHFRHYSSSFQSREKLRSFNTLGVRLK